MFVILLWGCNKDNTENDNDVTDYSIVETTSITSYFNTDSLRYSRINEGLLINIGVGKDNSINEEKLSILKQEKSLQPIISLELDEYFTRKIIACRSSEKSDLLSDSIICNTLGLDSSAISHFGNMNIVSGSPIFVKIIYLQKFGEARLNISDPQVNDYLTYRTNLYNTIDKDEIPIPPATFNGIFGNEYCESLTLGVYFTLNIIIQGVDCEDKNSKAAMQETICCINKMLEEHLNWNDQKNNTKYLRKSSFTFLGFSAIPRMNFVTTTDDLITELTKVSNYYQNWDFGILLKCYKPFSNIYPDYDFINSK